MKVVRHTDMKVGPLPPLHHDMASLPIQKTDGFVMSMSVYLPGGSVDKGAVTSDIAYLILEGEMTVLPEGAEKIVLGKYDSISFQKGDVKTVVNASNLPAIMLIVKAP